METLDVDTYITHMESLCDFILEIADALSRSPNRQTDFDTICAFCNWEKLVDELAPR